MTKIQHYSCRDIKQTMDEMGIKDSSELELDIDNDTITWVGEHNALTDANWCKRAHHKLLSTSG